MNTNISDILTSLTEKETVVMTVCTETEFDGSPWNFAVEAAAGFPKGSYGGVVASLIKKGLCSVEDYCGKERADDMVFCLTDTGKHVNAELHARKLPEITQSNERFVIVPTKDRAKFLFQMLTTNNSYCNGVLTKEEMVALRDLVNAHIYGTGQAKGE